MPFDGLTFRSLALLPLTPDTTLETAAARAGLKHLDFALLERHKAAEIERHEPGWLYRHRGALQPAFGLAVVACSLGFVVLEARGLGVAAGALGVVLLAMVALAMLKTMRGPARWEERSAPDLSEVHPQIADAARRLRKQRPDVELRLGELFQDRVMLDPYLVAVAGDEQLLLGIWDGATVILSA
jgi:hypothetical protein